jgi:hypothetical protein
MADTSTIPSISYAIRQAQDRLQYQHDIYNQEFKERLKLVFGHPDYIADPAYGVVSSTNPGSTLSGSGDPLAVSINSTNTLSLDINPGLAVNQNGHWIQLSNFVRQFPLANAAIGVVNVVYLRYYVVAAAPETNDYYQSVIPYTTRPGGFESPPDVQQAVGDVAQVQVDQLDVYLNYTDEVRRGFVPIAVVTMQVNSAGYSLAIDHTQDSYAWNRPWFSAYDVAHRVKLGTGVQTSTNVHALSQNDLTIGHFTPLQLQLDHGMVVADDQSIGKVPGYRCEVSVPYVAGVTILTDDGVGTYTGCANKQYLELPNYPIRLGEVWVEDLPANPHANESLAALIVEGTNRIVFANDAPPVNESIGVYYTRVAACEPPVGLNNITYSTNNPTDNELVIAGGVGRASLASTALDFSDAQKFPMVYDIVVDQDGNLVKTPQVIYCYKTLAALGTSDTFSITQYGPARIMMGLIGASGAATMSVKIRVYGKDAAGLSIDHLFEFVTGVWPGWAEPGPVPNAVITQNAFRISTQDFASVDQLAVEDSTDAGLGSAIVVWANLDPYSTYDKLKDACHVAEVMWDGLRMSTVQDKRIVGTTVRDFLDMSAGMESLSYLAHMLAGGNATVYAEDYRHPQYHSLIPNKDLPGVFYANLFHSCAPINNLSKLRPGVNGYYQTRALPVMSGSGVTWRVVILPLNHTRNNFYYSTAYQPELQYFVGGVWGQSTMPAVPGLPHTYELTLLGVPTRVGLWHVSAEHQGFILFG